MMRSLNHKTAHIFIAVIIILLSYSLRAQDGQKPINISDIPGVPGMMEGDKTITIQTSVDKSIIRVGDIINYKMVIEAPEGSNIVMPQPGSELGSFLIRDYSFPGEEKDKKSLFERIKNSIHRGLGKGNHRKDMVKNEFKYQITTYITGDLMVPPVPIMVVSPSGKKHNLTSQSVIIRVAPVTSPDDLTIKDIKGPASVPVETKKLLPFIIIPAIFLAALVIIIILVIKRRKEDEEIKIIRPPHETAFEELKALYDEDLLAKGDFERYYTRLSLILRKYVSLRFTMYALEYTTTEISDRLKMKKSNALITIYHAHFLKRLTWSSSRNTCQTLHSETPHMNELKTS